MNKLYESTRDANQKRNASQAILQGLSMEGGLFVLRDMDECRLDIESLLHQDYQTIAVETMKPYLTDFSEEEVLGCVKEAYTGKFASEEITPLVELSDAYVLELFRGPTSAFKDVGLSLLPQLIKTSLVKTNVKEDILILTATSGDTGKAALEGFKDVNRTGIMVFYPHHGVSAVQQRQMQTQEGKNTKVCAVNGNFDDCQSGIKRLFVDDEFKKKIKDVGFTLSSANSINIGRLIPQMVYYVYAYVKLVEQGKIALGDLVDFCVPTGNFGNILAGYYAKMAGLPIRKLICASNINNVLYDFIQTGIYDKRRDFLKTISPSMDILISSNLERLLYYLSDKDNAYVADLMKQVSENGYYEISSTLKKKMQETFVAGYADDEETKATIKAVYEKEHYLLDTHTAVAYKVMKERKDDTPCIVLATASPYKFTQSVYEALSGQTSEDEFALMDALENLSATHAPSNLSDLANKPILHEDVIEIDDFPTYVLKKAKELK